MHFAALQTKVPRSTSFAGIGAWHSEHCRQFSGLLCPVCVHKMFFAGRMKEWGFSLLLQAASGRSHFGHHLRHLLSQA